MAFIDQFEIESLKEKMTNDASRLGKIYKAKKNSHYFQNVDHNLVDDLILNEGWEEVSPRLKTKAKLRKPKSHSSKFEDDIWCQLYDLGFRYMSYDGGFKLPFGKDPKEKKQIDIIAVSDECILLVECKSSENPKPPPSYKTEFEGLPLRLAGFQKSLEQMFGKGRKIKYIFATRKLRIDKDSADIQRLLATNSFFYNDNTYEYIEGLIKAYKEAATYQFLALLFKGQSINKEKIEVPAVEGKMGGLKYYMFSIEPHLLLKIGFILHRTRANENEMPTYQRLLVPSRLKGISKFIQNGGYFPNSVILNFAQKKAKLQFESSSPRGSDTNSRCGILKIPDAYATAYIIDGQHRVYGYAQSEFKQSNTIPVVAFVDLEPTDQLKIFMDINENQKAVSATLRITLEEDLYWNSDRADSRIKALRSSIIQELGNQLNGPLHNKISIGEDKALLSANPFSTVLSKTSLLPSVKGNKYDENKSKYSLYNTLALDHGKEMYKAKDAVVKFINLCYGLVEDQFPELLIGEDSLILSNRGTYPFISIVSSFNEFETDQGNLSTQTTAQDRFDVIEKYLLVLLKGLKNSTDDDKKYLLGRLGAGAEMAWFRHFQSIVHEKYASYKPSDFVDWQERQDEELQDKGMKLSSEIEKFIKQKVIGNLKALYGDNWEIEIGSIHRDCMARASEEQEKRYKEGLPKKDIPWTDMFFITDYKKIIESYWTKAPENNPASFQTFADLFAIDIGSGFNSKAEKLKWLSLFNSYRNNLAHSGSKDKGLNKEEIDFLEKIRDALIS